MRDELQYLSDNLPLDYQRSIVMRLTNDADEQSVGFVEDLKDLLCNLYVSDLGKGLLIRNLLAHYDIASIARSDGATWPFIQDILLLKTLMEDSPERKQEIVEFIVNYGDDEFLIEKRFKRIKDGYLVKIAQDQYKKSSRKDLNAHYYLGVSLLLKLIQANLYQYYGKMEQFVLDADVQKMIDHLHGVMPEISSVSGD